MRAILSATLLLACLLAACPRGAAPPVQVGQKTATHPWELPGYSQPGGQPAAPKDGQAADLGQVELPAMRGPAFSPTDTLNPEYLPGEWLQVCTVFEEKVNLTPATEQAVLELGPAGRALFHSYQSGELANTKEGQWKKLRPGVLSLGFAQDKSSEVYAELYGQWFLFTWNYDLQTGIWFARILPGRNSPPLGTDYETTRGKLHLAEIVNNYFSGTVTGATTMQVRGYYNAGVVSLRWEDPQNNSSGFAAFLADPRNGTLYGVWWMDSFTSAPFGGPWQATQPSATPLPEDAPGASVAGNLPALDSPASPG